MGLVKKYSYYNRQGSILFPISFILFLTITIYLIVFILPKISTPKKFLDTLLILIALIALDISLLLIVIYSLPKSIILDNNQIKLPYKFKYKYPNPIELQTINIKDISFVSSDDLEKILTFLMYNKSIIFKPHMVSYQYMKNHPDLYIALEVNYQNEIFYIILIKRFLVNENEFISDISNEINITRMGVLNGD